MILSKRWIEPSISRWITAGTLPPPSMPLHTAHTYTSRPERPRMSHSHKTSSDARWGRILSARASSYSFHLSNWIGSGVMTGIIGSVGNGDGMTVKGMDVGVGGSAVLVKVGNISVKVAVGVVSDALHAVKPASSMIVRSRWNLLIRFKSVSIPLTLRFGLTFQPVC